MRYKQIGLNIAIGSAVTAAALSVAIYIGRSASEAPRFQPPAAENDRPCRLPESEVRKWWVMAGPRNDPETTQRAKGLIEGACALRYLSSTGPAVPLPTELQGYSR